MCLLSGLSISAQESTIDSLSNTSHGNTSEFLASHQDSTPSDSEAASQSIIESREELNARADSAYSADNYNLAEELYLQSINSYGTSSVIFYNLGNTYYRQGFLGKAIINYERALKLDPTNADAKANLAFVRAKITDRQLNESSVIDRLWERMVMAFKADTWAWISIFLFAIFLAGVLTYLFSNAITIRKVSFFGGFIIFLLCVAAIIISFAAANKATSDKYAIILTPSVQLSTTPREARNAAEEAFILHEGTKVEIVDSISTAADGKWYEVLVGSNDRAWIKAADVERI